MLYLDSNALVALTVGGYPVDELAEYLRRHKDKPRATSTIGFTETVRNAALHGQYPRLMSQLGSMLSELILTTEIRDAAANLPRGIRSLDALHIATALSIAEYLTVMISYDRRLVESARDQGLPVASPGMDL